MAKTALELSPEEWTAYFPAQAVSQRHWDSDEQVERRWQNARKIAVSAADLLRYEFGAEKVWVFGSLSQRQWFTPWSDIDLAVEGIRPDLFYAAVARVIRLADEIKVDLVDLSTCYSELRAKIVREGIEI